MSFGLLGGMLNFFGFRKFFSFKVYISLGGFGEDFENLVIFYGYFSFWVVWF